MLSVSTSDVRGSVNESVLDLDLSRLNVDNLNLNALQLNVSGLDINGRGFFAERGGREDDKGLFAVDGVENEQGNTGLAF